MKYSAPAPPAVAANAHTRWHHHTRNEKKLARHPRGASLSSSTRLTSFIVGTAPPGTGKTQTPADGQAWRAACAAISRVPLGAPPCYAGDHAASDPAPLGARIVQGRLRRGRRHT